MLAILVTHVLRIASIIKLRANGKLRIIGKSHIVVCDENIQPCSFFRWIFLPHSILQNKNTLTRILRHENTHIRQLHTIDVLLGESMAALCWINPLSWLLLKEIRLNLEYMADKAAIPDEQEKRHTNTCYSTFHNRITNSLPQYRSITLS